MKCFYGLFPAETLKPKEIRTLMVDLKADGKTYNERMGFRSEEKAQEYLDSTFKEFKDRMFVTEYFNF